MNGFELGLSLDRINVNKGYSPRNCRWVATEVQLRNQRKSVRMTHNGITLNASQWAHMYGKNRGDVAKRIREGMKFEDIFPEASRKDYLDGGGFLPKNPK